MATHITQDDLLEAVAATLRPLPAEEAVTANELCEMSGKSKPTVLVVLRKLKQQGRLEPVRVPRETIDGRVTLVVGYRLKPAPKRKR